MDISVYNKAEPIVEIIRKIESMLANIDNANEENPFTLTIYGKGRKILQAFLEGELTRYKKQLEQL